MSNQHKNPTISFRITDAERKQIEAQILASGMMKKDYFVRSCIYNRICVVGKKETIYPLVQTVNALYLQLLEMQKVFTATSNTSNTLPSSETIKELQFEYTNMLTAIIDLPDGAKYLWRETVMNNKLNFRFGMYYPATDSIIVNTGENSILVICCKHPLYHRVNSTHLYKNPSHQKTYKFLIYSHSSQLFFPTFSSLSSLPPSIPFP